MSLVFVDLDRHIEDIAEKLGDLHDQTPKVLRSALSNTSRRIRKQVLKEAQARYAYQDDSAWKATNKGALHLKAGTKGDKFYTRLFSAGPMSDLSEFMTNPAQYVNKGETPPARVLNASALKILGGNPKPFVTKFKSGHIAVVARVPGKSYSKSWAIQQRKDKNYRGSDLTKIASLLSPSVPSMVQNAGLRETAESMLATELPIQIQKAIDRTLRKAGRA